MSRKCERKARELSEGVFSHEMQYNCPMCGDACVCVRLNLFPADKPVFATLRWVCGRCAETVGEASKECERCRTETKDGEQNGN